MRSKRRGLLHSRIRSARLQRFHCAFGGERKDAEENERECELPAQLELPELRSGVDADDRHGKHAELTHPIEGPCAQGRESHRQIDHEERKHGSEPQREQIVGAFLFDACVHRVEAGPELALDPLAQQHAGRKEGERCPDRRSERDEHRAPDEPEERACDERENQRSGNRQSSDRDVNQEEHCRGAQRRGRYVRRDRVPPGLEELEGNVLPQIEHEECDHERAQHGAEKKPATRHVVFRLLDRAAAAARHPSPRRGMAFSPDTSISDNANGQSTCAAQL